MDKQIRPKSRKNRGLHFKTRLSPRFPAAAFAAISITLLLLFMVMTPLTPRLSNVIIPQSNAALPASTGASRCLTIGADGAITLDGRLVAGANLSEAFRAIASFSPQPTLRVRGAKGLTYGQVKSILDQARNQGISDIRIEVSRDKESDAPVK